MAFNKVTRYGESETILDSEVGLVPKTREATQSMAADIDGRKVIKAGTLYTNPDDATEIGVFMIDYDMTDYEKYPVAIVMQGRLKADKVADAVTKKKTELAARGLYLV